MPKRTAAWVRSVTKAGKYGDLHGLILRVQPSGSKAWIWRGTVGGKRRDLGLGRYPYVSLAEARAQAFEYRKAALEGGDPTTLRSGSVPTFTTAAEEVIALYAGKWKPGGKSEGQWRQSLATYVLPAIGSKRVDEVTSGDVMDCLAPIWNSRPETAKRVRQRIAAVMKWAIAQGYRQDNPAGGAVTAASAETRERPQTPARPAASRRRQRLLAERYAAPRRIRRCDSLPSSRSSPRPAPGESAGRPVGQRSTLDGAAVDDSWRSG